MDKILVPIDFSDYAERTVDFALGVARVIKAEIVLFHAFTMPSAPAGSFGAEQKIIAIEEKHRTGLLKELANKHKGPHFEGTDIPVPVQTHFTVAGELSAAVMHYIQKNEGVRYVMMGTKGASGLNEVLFGSHTVDVVKHSPVPVFAIPREAHLRPIRKMAYATNFDEKDHELIDDILIPFAKAIGASLECVHVSVEADTIPDSHLQKYEDVEHVQLNVIKNPDPAEGIQAFVKENNVDLLVLLTHERGFWKELFHHSVTEDVAFHSVLPMMIVK